MLHSDVLRRLFPGELGGVFDGDLSVEGASLDRGQAAADLLLAETFPDTTGALLPDWERVCGLTPGSADTVQVRQQRVVAKLRERGALSIPYFSAILTSMGYSLAIEELVPNAPGHGADSVFIWRIHISGEAVYYFRAGQSCAGEPLCWWQQQGAIESLLQDVKPAHTELLFAYA